MKPFLLLNPKTREIALVTTEREPGAVITVIDAGHGLTVKGTLGEDLTELDGSLGKGVVDPLEEPAPDFARSHTPAGVAIPGQGWGTVLYASLALAATSLPRLGVASPAYQRSESAEAWWQRAVAAGFAQTEVHWYRDLVSWVPTPVRFGILRRADVAQELWYLRGVHRNFDITRFVGPPPENLTLRKASSPTPDVYELFAGRQRYHNEQGVNIHFDAEFEVNILRAETAAQLLVSGFESDQFSIASLPLAVLTGLRVVRGELLGEVATTLVIQAFLACDASLDDQIRGFQYFAAQNRLSEEVIEGAIYRMEPRIPDKLYLALTERTYAANSKNSRLEAVIEDAYDAEFGDLRELP